MTDEPKQSKLRHAFEFATKGTVILGAGLVGSRLMGDPLPAMYETNAFLNRTLLNRKKDPQPK